ncbi:MAG: glycerol-3-phosphate dehydrogenase [Oscillospiraceae bacterium]|jgi:glycerol-3-phosphate dehydrogenase (NAD(P)+)|nr:glycerol-3-phosphate dehydrogenase [Oscillospiraceae bacterium]
MLKISVLGSGRWGSLIAWYLNKIGYNVILWGKPDSIEIKTLIKNRNNGSVYFDEKVAITSELTFALTSDLIVISINAQNLRIFLGYLIEFAKNKIDLSEKKIVLCMKGIEESTGKRLTEIVHDFLPTNNKVAIWVGPGHVKSIVNGIPTCMVVDSLNNDLKFELAEIFSSELIRCYFGNDLIGNEIGAASKNVFGIAAGILDALDLDALKGPLMARGLKEISILIEKMGGKKESACGLCHLGDYQATLFSKESNNRKFGESLITGEITNFIAEGVGTSYAIKNICQKHKLNMPICHEIYKIITKRSTPELSIKKLFMRNICQE